MANINELFERYLNNSCTEEELGIILRYFEWDGGERELKKLVESELGKEEGTLMLSSELRAIVTRNRTAIQGLETVKQESRQRVRKLWIRWASVAASVLLLAAVAWLVVDNSSSGPTGMHAQTDVDPGTYRAVLTLADGQTIALSDVQQEIVVDGQGINYADGTDLVSALAAQEVVLTTPRKGQYQATLPDGTRVWLNAESSLRYPTHFSGGERLVTLEGEAYFEVTPNTRQPFVVETSLQRLEVLGTAFNVNAYQNEPATVTTLVSGRVALNGSVRLEPKEQAMLSDGNYTVHAVDIRPYTSWREGEFRFTATPLPAVIRQLERWYDLEVDYTQIPSDMKIHAIIQRDKKLSSVLYALEEVSDVKFEVKGRRLQLME